MPTIKPTIAEKLAQLEELLSWFESDDITIEAATEKYEEALKLAQELEVQLTTAQNKIEVVKQKFNV